MVDMSESERTYPLCMFCRKPVYKQRNGAWYHRGNGSASCSLGSGSRKKALPSTKTVALSGRR